MSSSVPSPGQMVSARQRRCLVTAIAPRALPRELARQPPAFVPAAKVRGEGVFTGFWEAEIEAWAAQNEGREAQARIEHIYSRRPREEGGPMAGVLFYTAAPDSEGTLGGLVLLGHPAEFGRLMALAQADLRLCASDLLCAEHAPPPEGGPRTLHGAACHACAFSPETSCERGNKYLDRCVVVDTISPKTISFFDAWQRRRDK